MVHSNALKHQNLWTDIYVAVVSMIIGQQIVTVSSIMSFDFFLNLLSLNFFGFVKDLVSVKCQNSVCLNGKCNENGVGQAYCDCNAGYIGDKCDYSNIISKFKLF